jgi:hypothetical protein
MRTFKKLGFGRGSSFALSILALATYGCIAAEEEPEVEPTAGDEQALHPIGFMWSSGTKAIEVVQMLYKGRNWFNCSLVGNCGPSEAHIEATRVINELGALIEQNERNELMAVALTLLDDAKRDYGQPHLLSADEEARLISQATEVHRRFFTKLLGTIHTDSASVESAYRLARMFNVVAALVDNIGQLALARGQAPMNPQWILDKRAQTLQANLALVGAQNLWYDCPGAAPREVSNVESLTNAFATKKLWKKFADYKFAYNDFGNDCNVFRSVTGQHICAHDCSNDFPAGLCRAGVLPPNEPVYRRELPKILGKMNRDPVVSDIRKSIETLVGLAADGGGGVLWQNGGNVDAWRITSATSYDQFRVGGATSDFSAFVTGDFDGDGDGDVLLKNSSNLLSLWLLQDKRMVTQTSATANAPSAPAGTRFFSGDFDGDRVSDLIWSQPYVNPRSQLHVTTTWLSNPGSTTPRSVTDSAPASEFVQGVAHFDNDAQRRIDVLYRASGTGDVSIAMNGGGKTFLGWAPSEWTIRGTGDFDADGYGDILLYDVVAGGIAVWTTRNGSVIQNVRVGTVAPDQGWEIAGVTDIDHDGYSDIVWRHSSGSVSNWMMSGPSTVREYTQGNLMDPNARFVGTIEFGPPTPANKPVAVLTEAVCGVNGKLRNPGFKTYEQWWGNTFDGGSGTFLGDVDGDTRADLVSVGGNYVGVIRSTGTGFGAYEQWRSESITGTFANLFGDVTGDGRSDLITRGNGYIKVWPSEGTRFGTGSFWYSFTMNGSRGNLVGDVDGDHKADLVALGDNNVIVVRSTGGSFGSGSFWRTQAAFGSRATFLGDVTGDGRADLVAVNGNNIKIWPSTGTSFAEPTIAIATFGGSRGTLFGDVDGDGLSDLVALEDRQVRVLRARGGTFEAEGLPYYETWWGSAFYGNRGNFIGDLDGNARLDIVGSGDGYIGALRSQ